LIKPGKRRNSRIDFDCQYLLIPFPFFPKSHQVDQTKKTHPERMSKVKGDR